MHPPRRLPLVTREKVERSTNADHDWCFYPAEMRSHPSLLFWRTESYPDDVRGRGVDGADEQRVLGVAQCAERRRAIAADVEGGELLAQALRESINNLRRTAEKEMPWPI